jgi:hypothetical protein
MPVLATFTFVGALSIAGASDGCIAHGLPTQPDWVTYQSTLSHGSTVGLVTRANAGVWLHNEGGSPVPGEVIAQFCHSIIR